MNQVFPDMNDNKVDLRNTSNPTDEKIETKAEASSVGSGQPKEVDYYLNPTELFRWINYRRWDGAKSRVLSHPDECSTWIVSRHITDGRVLWRHLPLHLVCMQSESGDTDIERNDGMPTQDTRSIEELVDILLEAYPDASSSSDDQGMLPLHLAVTSSSLNAQIIYLLLTAYPNGVNAKDEFGSTPIDLLAEKKSGPNYDAVFRAMTRVQESIERHNATLRKENSSVIESLKKGLSNERSASQQIMLKLEKELVEAKKKIEESENKTRNEEKNLDKLKTRIETLLSEKEEIENSIEVVRTEREELINQNEILGNEVHELEKNVKAIHQPFEDSQQEYKDTIAKLKSECSTAKVMTGALESQLQSRFANEQSLAASISKLEYELAEVRTQYKQEKARLLQERDFYENKNILFQRSIEELTKNSASLQLKLTEANKHLSAVLTSHEVLNAEHDRMIENNLRTETDLIEYMRMERTNLLASMRKQMEFFKSTIQSKSQLLKDSELKEMHLLDVAKIDRDKSLETIESLRRDFENARASALERQMMLQTDRLSTLSLHNKARQSLNTEDLKSILSIGSSLDRSRVSQERITKTMDRSDNSTSKPIRRKEESSDERSLSTVNSGQLSHLIIETRLPVSSDKSNSTEARQQPTDASNRIESKLFGLREAIGNRDRRRQEDRYISDTHNKIKPWEYRTPSWGVNQTPKVSNP